VEEFAYPFGGLGPKRRPAGGQPRLPRRLHHRRERDPRGDRPRTRSAGTRPRDTLLVGSPGCCRTARVAEHAA
jgi:hypothetical protein